jgi:hypothetical protein
MFSLQSVLEISKERYISRSIVELGLATIYTYHISIILHTHAHLDLIVSLNSLWIHCLTLQYMKRHAYNYYYVFSTPMSST